MYQPPLPEKYQQMTAAGAEELIRQHKKQFADRLVILGHHYQRDDIIRFADFTGDSLELSQIAARQKNAEFIVFCGVHFMAESAEVLSSDNQKVLLPDLTAGCSMADMAEIDQVEECWQILKEKLPNPDKLVPVTYVNSSAAIKAFCGEAGGLCCTSSNCQKVFESIWRRDEHAVILFMPDEHLGRNTAYAMGNDLDTMELWDPYQPQGGITDEKLTACRLVLWKGFCSVHQEFTVEQIAGVRAESPDTKVIVHPECCFAVAQQADYLGSTSYIIKTIRSAGPDSSWAVGTEINLVNRLAAEMAPKSASVRSLSQTQCLCETMYRIDLPHLAWLLNMLAEHVREPATKKLINRIVVPENVKQNARLALERMLALSR